MRRGLLLFVPLLMAQSQPPLVPEGIHSAATERPNLCGLAAASVAELERKIMGDPAFREENSNERYRVFNRRTDFVQFVFPRPGFLTFPMATCMKLNQVGEGPVTMTRQMHCMGTRDQCDRLFIQWNEHDNELRQSVNRRRD
jgi:hypothetical protein